MSNGLKITNIDFSEDNLEQSFEIEHDASSPMCLGLRVVDKHPEENDGIDHVMTLRASEMRALGKALVFAAEYVEQLYGV